MRKRVNSPLRTWLQHNSVLRSNANQRLARTSPYTQCTDESSIRQEHNKLGGTKQYVRTVRRDPGALAEYRSSDIIAARCNAYVFNIQLAIGLHTSRDRNFF